MEPLKEELRKALSDALDKRRRDDTLETAVGREVRRAGLRYQDYLDIMEAARVLARKDKLDPWKAAQALMDQQ
ncbi:MAG TPA: hypothetical protein HA343_07925 [Methanomassiliicoccales archaeon]|nr:hypothetical protein [Methanomassiliicoccales archaeon]